MSDEAHDLLRGAARGPSAAADADILWRRGRRRRLLLAGATAGAAALLLVGVAVALPLARGGDPVILAPGPAGTGEPGATSTSEPSPGATRRPGEQPGDVDRGATVSPDATGSIDGAPVHACEPPPYRPTYLPWLAGGEAPGEPHGQAGGTTEQPSAVLYWAEHPATFAEEFPAYSGVVVTLSTNHELAREVGEAAFPEVEVQGHDGELVWIGDPGVGGVAVIWREGPDPCGSYSVGFDMTRGLLDHIDFDPSAFDDAEGSEIDELMLQLEQQIEAELLRVAESLERVTRP